MRDNFATRFARRKVDEHEKIVGQQGQTVDACALGLEHWTGFLIRIDILTLQAQALVARLAG